VKAFRFNLERVLDWRTVQLRTAEEKLTQLRQQLAALLQQEEQVLAAYRDNSAKVLSSQTIEGVELQRLAAFRVRTTHLLQAILRQRAQYEALILEQRQRLLKARKDHRILEKLRDTRFKNWVYLNDREIESTAAEAYLSNWNRREADGKSGIE
jgi:flagellar export protein FliJ